MWNRTMLAVVLAIGLSLISAQAQKMKTDIPPTITTPDSVETRLGTLKFTDGYPTMPPRRRSMTTSTLSTG